MNQQRHVLSKLQLTLLLVLFFFSGFSALCYQLTWQRMLFAAFGINIESVTIIVSLFMFGLGVGSLLGIWLQRFPHYLLLAFVACEAGIGLFGLISQSLIQWLATLQALDSLTEIAFCVYAALALPTLLMGATLPLMTSFIDRTLGHTGKTVGLLYACNTMGAMTASYLIVRWFFVKWGLQTTVLVAVSLNFITAISAFALGHKRRIHSIVEAAAAPAPVERSIVATTSILFLSFAIGYLSLSQELVWYRVLGFITSNRPQIFGLLLASYLGGIAAASLLASRISDKRPQSLYHYICITLLIMQFVWYLSFPYLIKIAGRYGHTPAMHVGLAAAFAVAFFSGGIFPALCHLLQGRTGESAGSSVGKIYLANVMGATLGPVITGFVLFDLYPLPAIVLYTGFAAALLLFLVLLTIRTNLAFRLNMAALCLAAIFVGYQCNVEGYNLYIEKMQDAGKHPGAPYDFKFSNRSGVITVKGDQVYGNGAYDGRINTDPNNDTNDIWRAYAIATMHPDPKKILQIGLSSGSWANVISSYQPLKSLTVVEINPGYLNLVEKYKKESSILTNDKVNIVIDDGRRWLLSHPLERFDMIIMNTIYYWRSNSTNLLSEEFLTACKDHLKPGGLVYINTTGAEDVTYTAAHVFNYVSTFGIMVIAGDKENDVPRGAKLAHMREFLNSHGKPIYALGDHLRDMVVMTYPNQRNSILRKKGLWTITDDNMATEFKKR